MAVINDNGLEESGDTAATYLILPDAAAQTSLTDFQSFSGGGAMATAEAVKDVCAAASGRMRYSGISVTPA